MQETSVAAATEVAGLVHCLGSQKVLPDPITGDATVPKSGLFQFVFCIKKWYVVVVFPFFLPVHHQSLRLSKPNVFADRQYARTHPAASGVLFVTCKWRYCCRFWALHGGFTWSVLLSVVSGRGILCGPLERGGASRLCHRGIRLQAASASCAHVSCSGGREPMARVQMQLTGNRHFLGVLRNKRAPLLSAENCLNNGSHQPLPSANQSREERHRYLSGDNFGNERKKSALACTRSLPTLFHLRKEKNDFFT